KNTVTHHIETLSLHDALPILFKEKLLKTKSATIKYFYDNGQIVNKHWDASRFTKESSLMGNITSKSGIRKKERIEQGVIKVELTINEHTSELQSRENLVCRLL